jgi:hypothetical protein
MGKKWNATSVEINYMLVMPKRHGCMYLGREKKSEIIVYYAEREFWHRSNSGNM